MKRLPAECGRQARDMRPHIREHHTEILENIAMYDKKDITAEWAPNEKSLLKAAWALQWPEFAALFP